MRKTRFRRRSACAALIALTLSAVRIGDASAAPPRRVVAKGPASPLLTLEQAQQFAVANHPDIKARQFDELAAVDAVRIARAAYSPQVYGEAVSALAPPGTRISAYNALSDPTIVQRAAAGLGAAQYITDFGRTANDVRAAEFTVRAEAAARAATRDAVLLNVTAAYFEVLRSGALAIVAQQTQRERRTLLTQVRALQRAGLRSTLDTAIAARDLSGADQLALQATNEREDAFATLAQAMGMSEQRTYALQDIRALPGPQTSLNELFRTAYRASPALASLQERLAAARSRVLATGKLGLPSVYAYGFVGGTPLHARNEAINSSYETVGVTLNVPLFDGGALAAQRRQARDVANAAAEAVEAERNRLAHDVRVAYDGVQTSRGNIAVTDRFLSTARDTLKLTEARYRIGLNSIVDLSAAQLSVTQAAIARTNATYDYIVQEAALEFATGIIATANLPEDARSSDVYGTGNRTPAPAPALSPVPKHHHRFP